MVPAGSPFARIAAAGETPSAARGRRAALNPIRGTGGRCYPSAEVRAQGAAALYFELANLLIFAVLAVGFVALNLVIARLLRPRLRVEGDKLEIYECGEPTVGQAWVRFDIRFYSVALMFVVFDVEVALLVPWGVIFRDFVERGLGGLAFLEAGAFLVVLLVGLAYVWARGDIDWAPERPEGSGSGGSDYANRSVVVDGSAAERELVGAGANDAKGPRSAADGGTGV